MKIVPVILSGGIGSRLWPLSRKQHPKQFLHLLSDKTILQETILRLNSLDNLSDPIIVCNEEHRFFVAEQCRKIDLKNPTILLEPVRRNTAPAIAAAALQTLKVSDDSILLILPADHVIKDNDSFYKSINIALKQTQEGKISTFGIVPTNANIGYGYIKSSTEEFEGAFKVNKFVEKPNLLTAQSYIDEGNYFWNSGMFMFKASVFLNELNKYSSNIVKFVSLAIELAEKDLDFIRLDKKAFVSTPAISIDYALMEKSKNVVVVPLNAQWNDLGTWSSLYDVGEKDNEGNVIKGNSIIKDTTNTYINTTHNMLVTIGIDNLIIVNTADVTLVSRKDKVEEVKSIVERLGAGDNSKIINKHRKVFRPWGWYDSLEEGENFHVKRIRVKPGASLSLQKHKYRSEHWVVVKGTATVLKDDETFVLTANQSTYIQSGELHSLKNESINEILEIIEVQTGSYFGEDDIVRYKDKYNRK